MPRMLLPLAAIAALALASAPALAEHDPKHVKKDGTPDAVAIEVQVLSPTAGRILMEQGWAGARAVELRSSLDAYFGNGDANLSADELERIVNATENDLRGKPLPWLTLDATPPTVSDVQVTLSGSGGPGDPVIMRHDISIAFTPGNSTEHSLGVRSLWDARLTVRAPEGWSAAIKGQSPSSGAVGAEVREGMDAMFVVGPGLAAPTPDESIDEEGPAAPGTNAIPGAGMALGAALAAMAALVLRRR